MISKPTLTWTFNKPFFVSTVSKNPMKNRRDVYPGIIWLCNNLCDVLKRSYAVSISINYILFGFILQF